MKIEFDEAKNLANITKHGISLIEAYKFDLDSAIVVPDVRRDYGERRFVALGYIGSRLHIMIFTPRAESIRVISLRKANTQERKKYGKKI